MFVSSRRTELELSDRPMGCSTPSVSLHNGQDRVDFANGHLEQGRDGFINTFYVENANRAWFPAVEIRGR